LLSARIFQTCDEMKALLLFALALVSIASIDIRTMKSVVGNGIHPLLQRWKTKMPKSKLLGNVRSTPSKYFISIAPIPLILDLRGGSPKSRPKNDKGGGKSKPVAESFAQNRKRQDVTLESKPVDPSIASKVRKPRPRTESRAVPASTPDLEALENAAREILESQTTKQPRKKRTAKPATKAEKSSDDPSSPAHSRRKTRASGPSASHRRAPENKSSQPGLAGGSADSEAAGSVAADSDAAGGAGAAGSKPAGADKAADSDAAGSEASGSDAAASGGSEAAGPDGDDRELRRARNAKKRARRNAKRRRAREPKPFRSWVRVVGGRIYCHCCYCVFIYNDSDYIDIMPSTSAQWEG
jgi:hypothetical protein